MTRRRDTWERSWPEYRESADGRYVYGDDRVWRYGPADTALAGLAVPGAVEIRLDDLVTPVPAEAVRRPPERRWGPSDDGFPGDMSANDLYISADLVRRVPEVGALDTAWYLQRDYMTLTQDQWRKGRGRVVRMRAPELASGYVRSLAHAERDVRRTRRQRDDLVARRRALLLAARVRGIEPYKLARVLGLSRARMHQLLVARATVDDLASEPKPLVALRKVHAALQNAEAALLDAERVRRRRVQRANREFRMGLGEIAAILDTTRSRAQQLRDQAEAELGRLPEAPPPLDAGTG